MTKYIIGLVLISFSMFWVTQNVKILVYKNGIVIQSPYMEAHIWADKTSEILIDTQMTVFKNGLTIQVR